MSEPIDPPRQRFGVGPTLSQAVQVGNLVFLSGQVAYDADGRLVGEGDALEQARQCFRNIERLLAPLGATLAHVTKITGYLTDVQYAGDYLRLREELFKASGPPASTAVVVTALLDPRLLIEVEAIAVIDTPAG